MPVYVPHAHPRARGRGREALSEIHEALTSSILKLDYERAADHQSRLVRPRGDGFALST
jgi:hypothetical protein